MRLSYAVMLWATTHSHRCTVWGLETCELLKVFSLETLQIVWFPRYRNFDHKITSSAKLTASSTIHSTVVSPCVVMTNITVLVVLQYMTAFSITMTGTDELYIVFTVLQCDWLLLVLSNTPYYVYGSIPTLHKIQMLHLVLCYECSQTGERIVLVCIRFRAVEIKHALPDFTLQNL